ncbi:virulence RhuM family protein [Patescibacteria group bacterium]|nr:virulence RhuM family protein [Patescibacteria group bacterium]
MPTKSNQKSKTPPSEIILYRSPTGEVKVEVRFKDETVWLTQYLLAKLFGVDRSVITKHLNNIFESGELEQKAVSAKFAHTAADGKTYRILFYNLDAIIAVGYRVNSKQATHFRIWATKVLNRFLKLSDYTILENKGKISQVQAEIKAAKEYKKFRVIQDRIFESDFDKMAKKFLKKKKP